MNFWSEILHLYAIRLRFRVLMYLTIDCSNGYAKNSRNYGNKIIFHSFLQNNKNVEKQYNMACL